MTALPIGGKRTGVEGMNAIAGGTDGLRFVPRCIAASPLGAFILGVGSFVSGSSRSCRARSVVKAALPALCRIREMSTPSDCSVALSERLEPWSRGRPEASCIAPR